MKIILYKIDDCRNITKILKRLIMDGCVLKITTDKSTPEPVRKAPENTAKDNPELVSLLLAQSKNFITIDNLQITLQQFPNITEREFVKLKGLFNKHIIDLIKTDGKFLELSPNDKKSFNSQVLVLSSQFVDLNKNNILNKK